MTRELLTALLLCCPLMLFLKILLLACSYRKDSCGQLILLTSGLCFVVAIVGGVRFPLVYVLLSFVSHIRAINY